MMKSSILTIVLFFSLNNAFAGNTNEQPNLSLVVSEVHTDLDKDSIIDNAYLVHSTLNNGSLDLWVSLSSSNRYYKATGVASDLNGHLFGQGTELTLNPQGSVVVHSYNEAISRSRWDMKVTFAYRRGGLVLAGFTWNERDTLDLSHMACDINLLSRNATVEGAISRGFDVNEEPKVSEYSGVFEVSREDVLAIDSVNEDNLLNLYQYEYCSSIPAEIAGDIGEAEDF